jgi:hypothetical protein
MSLMQRKILICHTDHQEPGYPAFAGYDDFEESSSSAKRGRTDNETSPQAAQRAVGQTSVALPDIGKAPNLTLRPEVLAQQSQQKYRYRHLTNHHH